MSETIKVEPVKLEDLNYFWTKSGLPCFYADRENIVDIIEDLGFSIYYMICTVAEDRPNTGSTTITYSSTTTTSSTPAKPIVDYTTSIVKVVNNIVGRSVSVVEEDLSDLAVVRETAEYNLPPIPRIIVDKLDEFFRLVDAQHGTESIVLLTFDPSKNDSSGWGVLVPDQTNTSVHCNYNPDSIVEEKPDHVLIVGSVHSHPNMAAYASGTDHADQADFDGLHITYGWQKTVNNGATQYHLEMQMGGTSWTLKPEDVFESFVINKDPHPDVVNWSTKVKKALPPQRSAGVSSTLLPAPQQTHSTHTAFTDLGNNFTTKGVPEVTTNEPHILVAEIDPDKRYLECPSCYYTLSEYDFQLGYCKVCDIPLASAKDNVKDILDQAKWYLSTRKIENNTAVYLWTKDSSTKEELVMKIGYSHSNTEFDTSNSTSITIEEYHNDSFDDEDYFDPDLTVCCGTNVLDLSSCRCDRPVLYEDVVDFEHAHSEVEIYDWESPCYNCKFFSAAGCLDYVDAVIEYTVNRKMVTQKITGCSNYVSVYASSSLEIRK